MPVEVYVVDLPRPDVPGAPGAAVGQLVAAPGTARAHISWAHEDAQTTLEGILDTVTAVVAVTAAVATRTWQRRRSDPDLIRRPPDSGQRCPRGG
ncbi:hypothetical protein [Yinghuangia seranimata]|uniref:hypothetical protein n=1 Tax=Yinghuangia seranimata TaxID=408067 RepID=UPI00248C450C|nr:hypothetical protein [Yinghuangia seranimata]MDI2127621.1 hypothetical protein [Yinghuangia seranimata]